MCVCSRRAVVDLVAISDLPAPRVSRLTPHVLASGSCEIILRVTVIVATEAAQLRVCVLLGHTDRRPPEPVKHHAHSGRRVKLHVLAGHVDVEAGDVCDRGILLHSVNLKVEPW